MEPIDSYLLAIGADFSITVMSKLNLLPKYLEYIKDPEHKRNREYLFLEVKRSNSEIVLATYISEREALETQGPEFKVIVNH